MLNMVAVGLPAFQLKVCLLWKAHKQVVLSLRSKSYLKYVSDKQKILKISDFSKSSSYSEYLF